MRIRTWPVVATMLVLASCGTAPDPVAAPTDPAEERLCDHPGATLGDVDGDGAQDRLGLSVSLERVDLCLATGEVLHPALQSNGEVLTFGDLDQDGDDELWAGGTSATAAGGDLWAWDGSALVLVRTTKGEVFELHLGGEQYGPDLDQWTSARDFGCEPTDTGGQSVVLRRAAVDPNDQTRVTMQRSRWQVSGALATLLDEEEVVVANDDGALSALDADPLPSCFD